MAGTTANTISALTSDEGSMPLLKKLEADLPDAFHHEARWFMAGVTLCEIRGLPNAAGGYAFPSVLHPLSGEDTLMTHPVSASSAMPADGVDGNTPVALIDLSKYVIGTRSVRSVWVACQAHPTRSESAGYEWTCLGSAQPPNPAEEGWVSLGGLPWGGRPVTGRGSM